MADGDPAPTAASDHVTANLTGSEAAQVVEVVGLLSFGVALPAIVSAFYVLRNLSKGGDRTPVHEALLLLSDVVGLLGRPRVSQDAASAAAFGAAASDFLFYFSVVSNITLMLCIAQERHLLVACPQCLACCGAVRRSPAVVLLAWAAPFAVLTLAVLHYSLWFSVCLLAPFPLLLFFALDSWRVLLCSRTPHPDPGWRRRTVWGISAICANYAVLYAPFVLSVLLEALCLEEEAEELHLRLVSHLLLYLGPLVDPFLYVLTSSGAKEVLRALPGCGTRRPKTEDAASPETAAETRL